MAESGEMLTRRTFAFAGLGAGIAGGLGGLTGCGRNKSHGIFGLRLCRKPGGWRDRGGGSGGVRCGAAHPRGWVADGRAGESQNARGYMRSLPETARCTRSAPTISPFRASCEWLPRPSKCGFRRPATHCMSCVRRPRQLVRLTLDPMQVGWTLPLPDDPADFDISPDGTQRLSARAPDAPSLSSISRTGVASLRCAPPAKSVWCGFSRSMATQRAHDRIRGN